jgi:hypothetical protein
MKLRGFSPQANYSNRATTACRRSWCQHLRIERCHVVNATDPHGRQYRFSRPEQNDVFLKKKRREFFAWTCLIFILFTHINQNEIDTVTYISSFSEFGNRWHEVLRAVTVKRTVVRDIYFQQMNIKANEVCKNPKNTFGKHLDSYKIK